MVDDQILNDVDDSGLPLSNDLPIDPDEESGELDSEFAGDDDLEEIMSNPEDWN
ncbi:MAG: hypothetical protein WC531_03760 [Candidatus Paceibacterota bacterium]|jgi:hypothetical protein